VRDAFDLAEPPTRIECFDISHTAAPTRWHRASYSGGRPLEGEYRRFNISGIAPGDDYAAMNQALSRRYKRVRDGEVTAPDVLLIDGGKGSSRRHARSWPGSASKASP